MSNESVRVYTSLIHCAKCNGNQWWAKPHFAAEVPTCLQCYPPPDGTQLERIPQRMKTWPNQRREPIEVKAHIDLRDGQRFTQKRLYGVKDRAIHLPSSGEWTDIMSAASERWIAGLLGVPVANSEVGLSGDKTDIIYCGHNIDVKWTPREDGRLLVKLDNKKQDIFVLVTGEKVDDFIVRGWATWKEVVIQTHDFGHGDTHYRDQKDLRAFPILLSWRTMNAEQINLSKQ
jgi:hypothetical protein